MNQFSNKSSEYIVYLDHTSTSQIGAPDSSATKDSLSNILKNNVLLYDEIIYHEIDPDK
jgi:hypothetical protein